VLSGDSMMMKSILLLVLWLSHICCAGLTFIPTIDGDESIWLEREDNIAFAESPFTLGVATPTTESSSFYLFFQYDKNNTTFDMSQMTHDVIDFAYDSVPGGMVIIGDFVGPGMIFDNIIIDGTGELGVYSGSWVISGADYLGTISIVPEPCSLVLLGLGGLVLRRRKR
jgi:hypothetical protein